MDPYGDYLSQVMPGFEEKPKPEIPPPPKAPAVEAGEPVEPAPLPEHPDPELFDSIAAYLSRYLLCDQHQLTVLTLWVAHTWCPRCFSTATYLNIRSPESQSGKSLCLQLLDNVCNDSMLANGISPGALMQRRSEVMPKRKSRRGPLDKSEGLVKAKLSLSMPGHRKVCQRS